MKFLVGLLLSVICFSLSAQPSEIKGLAGYVEFDELSGIYGEPKVRINIGEKLLHFVAKMNKDEDRDAARVLNNLKAVRVVVYRVNENAGPAIAMMKKVAEKLQTRDWEPVVTVSDEEEEEHVHIFVKLTGEVIDGLVVMAVDREDEAVFINIIGSLDPDQVGKVTRALNIDVDI